MAALQWAESARARAVLVTHRRALAHPWSALSVRQAATLPRAALCALVVLRTPTPLLVPLLAQPVPPLVHLAPVSLPALVVRATFRRGLALVSLAPPALLVLTPPVELGHALPVQ